MTLIINIPPAMEAQLQGATARQGIEPEQYILKAVEERLRRAEQERTVPPFQDLEAGYRAKAAEEQRKAEALEWAEGMRSCAD